MCGIAGYLSAGAIENGLSVLRSMGDAIRHRGPDAAGAWADDDAGIGLGHRRLSILDLSEAGVQPMLSHDGRLIVSFNGEIYNFSELKSEIEDRRGQVAWRGHSDTEVLIELMSEIGIEAALSKLDGMFAVAVFDRHSRKLTLARDPFGEKPLYYGLVGKAVVFASEINALMQFPGFKAEINPQSAADYFRYCYVPGPASIYRGVFKLPSASLVEITREAAAAASLPSPRLYWDKRAAALAGRKRGAGSTYLADVEALTGLLTDSTRRRMASDVPLGALLSGGIDSSLVTALMQSTSNAPVRTFSIGMQDDDFNEAEFAKAVSRHLGTLHTELTLSPEDVQAAIPSMGLIYDEPFADSSQIPTYLVSKLARTDVTVALSGDGGDELFGGYNRYISGPRLWQHLRRIPASPRRAAASLLSAMPPRALERLATMAGRVSAEQIASGQTAERLDKLMRLVSARDVQDLHDRLLSTTVNPEAVLANGVVSRRLADMGLDDLPFAQRAMLVDVETYLPDDVLTKVDRASMAVSLEVRTPFLNRALYEFAWGLPDEHRIFQGQGKRILRDLLYRLVPRELVDRPKSGFAVPIGRWLRQGQLRDWAEAGLTERRLTDIGILNVGEVRRRWAEHLSGRRNHDSLLWSILMYNEWHSRVR